MSTQQEARRRGGSIKYGRAYDEALPDSASLPDAAIIPGSVTPGAILTLRDNPILPVNHVALRSTRKPALLPTALDSDSDEWDGDVLEDTASRAKGPASKPRNAPYDPTDNAQFVDGAPKHPTNASGATEHIAQSVERPNSLLFESDYHLPPAASIPKRQRRLRKKRRRERSSTMAEDSAIPVAPVSRGHVDALRKATDNRETRGHLNIKNNDIAASDFQNDSEKDIENGDGDDDGDDDHYNALLQSRKRTQQINVKSSVNKILDAINDANEDGMRDDIQDSAYERGAKILSSEMHTFLQEDVLRPVVAAGAADADATMRDDTVERDRKNRSDLTNVRSTKSGAEEDEGNLTAAANRRHWKEQDLKASEPHDVKGTKEEDVNPPLSTHAVENNVVKKSDEVEEGTGMTGLAGTLKRLREMGQLTKKNEQIGRAKDRRAYNNDDSDKDDFDNRGSHKTSVKLSYLDDTGNELTPKEAFRLLCHKFHGNAPGKNKNEKRLKKMLEQMRVRNMRTDDTPLASAAALKEETRKLKTPHVVVSGVEGFKEGFKNSTAEDASSQAEPTESDDVKNRIVEPKVEFTIGRANNPLKRRRMQPPE